MSVLSFKGTYQVFVVVVVCFPGLKNEVVVDRHWMAWYLLVVKLCNEWTYCTPFMLT